MTRPFDATLRDIRFGGLVDELTQQMAALVAAVDSTQRAGELTLKIKLKPAGGGAMELTDEIKAKIPELPKGSSIFFGTPEGSLIRNDPRQPELTGLREVSAPTQALKEAQA